MWTLNSNFSYNFIISLQKLLLFRCFRYTVLRAVQVKGLSASCSCACDLYGVKLMSTATHVPLQRCLVRLGSKRVCSSESSYHCFPPFWMKQSHQYWMGYLLCHHSLPELLPALTTGHILSTSAFFRELTCKTVPIANCCSC